MLALTLLTTGCLTGDQTSASSALNRDRAAHGRRALGPQHDAQLKAQSWANQLARADRLSHSTLAAGIGVRWCNLGENVGVGSSIASVERAFMASSAHRSTILGSTWNGVGVGVAHRGNEVFVVQSFIQTC